jgi:hypothetical protein
MTMSGIELFHSREGNKYRKTISHLEKIKKKNFVIGPDVTLIHSVEVDRSSSVV